MATDSPKTEAPERQILRAAGAGDAESVQALLDDDPALAHARGRDGSTPLHMAAWKGKAAVVRLLLEAGADVNAHNDNTHWGTTPLHAAAHSNRKGIADLLIAHGADVNAKNPDGVTPLGTTHAHNATSAAKLLREHGATE
jgi:ankyrin repeat protein